MVQCVPSEVRVARASMPFNSRRDTLGFLRPGASESSMGWAVGVGGPSIGTAVDPKKQTLFACEEGAHLRPPLGPH